MGITPTIGKAPMSEKLVWKCHNCHEWMPERTTGMHGFLEWHICDTCMNTESFK